MIKLKVSAANIAVEEKETLTEGRVGLLCRFSFTGEWDGLAKTAVFDGADSRDVILTEDTVAVPAECLAAEGYSLSVGVYGKNAAGDIVIPTVYATVGKIQRSAYPTGKESAPPTPDVVAQIQQAAANAEAMARAVREDAELGKFKGEKGDKGDKGDTGATGADGKSAYAYAVEGGYTGTEEDFAAKLAAEMPDAPANPYPLEFVDPDTGETLASYDGSAPVAVEMPSGGGESAWETLIDTTLAEAAELNTGEVPGKTEMLCVFAVPKCAAAISLTASSKAFGKTLVGFSMGSASYGKIGIIFCTKVDGHATAVAASGDTTSAAPGLDTTPRSSISLNYYRTTDAPTDVPLKITSALPAGTIIKVFVR